MPEPVLSEGPPFPYVPGNVRDSARSLLRSAGLVTGVGESLRTTHRPALADVDGIIEAPVADVLGQPLADIDHTTQASTIAAGALGLYESARQTYNGTVDRLNQEWSEFSGEAYVPGSATDEQATAFQQTVAAKKTALRARQMVAEQRFEEETCDVVTLLDVGPDVIGRPQLSALVDRGLRQLHDGDDEQIRILNLNVGGGYKHGDKWGNENGFDPGDADGLAERILTEGTDIAALQEMWGGDLDAVEHELEERSGDDWTLTFAHGSWKYWWDENRWNLDPGGYDRFGNVVAVRAPDDGSEGETGLSIEDTETAHITPVNYGDVTGGDYGDGRSMAAVTIRAANGERVMVSTTHLDGEGDNGTTDQQQADEIVEFRERSEEFAEESGADHVVLTGDFNAQITDGDAAGQAIRDYEEAYENAGSSVGPTSDFGDDLSDEEVDDEAEDKAIDFIFTNDYLDYANVDRVEGDDPFIDGIDNNMADHDGIVLDINVP